MRASHLMACLACCGITAAWASEPPPAEFWLYLLEYANAQGEVLDPLDLEQLATADDTQSSAQAPATTPVQKEKTP